MGGRHRDPTPPWPSHGWCGAGGGGGARRFGQLSATRLGRKCQFVNLPGLWALGRRERGPRRASGGDLAEPGSQVAEKAGIRTAYPARCLCTLPRRKKEWGRGVGAPPSGEPRPQQCPACPGAPDLHTHVFSFICSLTYCCRHPTQSHRSTHSNVLVYR